MTEQNVGQPTASHQTSEARSRWPIGNRALVALGTVVSAFLVACSGDVDTTDPMKRIIIPSSAPTTTTTTGVYVEPTYPDENCGRPQQVDCDTYFGGASGGTGTLPTQPQPKS